MSTNTPATLAAALGYTPTDPEWRTTSTPPVPAAKFGKDHWNTFAYVETRIVDYRGLLDADHMRCNADRHPVLMNAKNRAFRFGGGGNRKYPTMLRALTKPDGTRGFEELPDHDDYDCVDDLIAAGLLEVHMPRRDPGGADRYLTGRNPVTRKMIGGQCDVPAPSFTTGLDELTLMAAARFTLTDQGVAAASALQTWKATGNNFHTFAWPPT